MTERSTSRWFKRKKAKSTPLKSGFMIIDEYGIARLDYSDPKLRMHLKKQIKQFSEIKVGT